MISHSLTTGLTAHTGTNTSPRMVFSVSMPIELGINEVCLYALSRELMGPLIPGTRFNKFLSPQEKGGGLVTAWYNLVSKKPHTCNKWSYKSQSQSH